MRINKEPSAYLHVMRGEHRVVLVEKLTFGSSSPFGIKDKDYGAPVTVETIPLYKKAKRYRSKP